MVCRYKQQQHVRNECLLMRKISHQFCTRLVKTFQDDLCVYLLLEVEPSQPTLVDATV